MIRWFVLILASTMAPVLSAEPVSIRSGEHASFVRLVIDTPVGADWKVGRVDNGFAIEIEGVSAFDTSTVYARISDSRIRGISVSPELSRLVLRSDCECHAKGFLWKPDKLVVDVIDGPGNGNDFLDKEIIAETPDLVLPLLPIPDARNPRDEVNSNDALNFEAAATEDAQLNVLEKIVVESLARAATQGLLAPAESLQSILGDTVQFDLHVLRNEPGLVAHTSIDDGALLANEDVVADAECLSSDYFTASEWAEGSPYSERIAQARAEITTEAGKIDPTKIVELAKVYISFGFGREAKHTLKFDGENSQEREIIAQIGAIIDGDTSDTTLLASQLRCDGEAALWALLATTGPTNVEFDRNGILRAYKALPSFLQSHLGPNLSKKFRDQSDFEAAEMVLSADVGGAPPTFETETAQVNLLSDLGKNDEAVEVLQELAESDSRMTPNALIDYLNLAVETGADISPEAIALGDILRYENKGDPIASELAAAQVAAQIEFKDLGSAFLLLADEAAAMEPEQAKELRARAVIAATQDYENTEFLELAFSGIVESLDAAAQNAVAARLLSLGLAERASQLVSGPAIGTAMQERRYLRAQAALIVGDGQGVLEGISGLSTERAVELREQATLVVAGRAELSIGGSRDDWKLGNWAALSQGSDPFLKDISRSILSDLEVPQGGQEPLADGRRLLAQSADMRDLLDDMLDRFQPVLE